MANNMTDLERVAELWQQWITEHDQPDATIHELMLIAERQARRLEEAERVIYPFARCSRDMIRNHKQRFDTAMPDDVWCVSTAATKKDIEAAAAWLEGCE